ncbi:hypothetical protein [uncultured Nitrosomonas sp.]|uniref:hypothetical protein n=1 Tax=uncultured Nitrosomonas sp. TaxID=156424 RepID=UPI0025F8C0C3|nr:hypothetical protein [uncultured Nitrosomonas sp.]
MSVGNRQTKEFEDEIEAGKLLVLVDVPTDRVNEVEDRVKQHLPQVEVEQIEPRVPSFP